MTARYPHIQKLLLDAEHRAPLAPLRLGMFVRANSGGRPTGITMQGRSGPPSARLIAEFSFWPLGWVLTFNDTPVEGTLDVCRWTEEDYHHKGDLRLRVPCQWALWIYPAMFSGSPATIAREYAELRGTRR